MQLLVEASQRAMQSCGLLQGARDVTSAVGVASLPGSLCHDLSDVLDRLQVRDIIVITVV